MKKIICCLLVCGCLFSTAFAANEEKIEDAGVKYEVKISIVYNAVSIEKANKISSSILKDHKDACKTEVAMGKVNSQALSYGSSSWIASPLIVVDN